MQTDGAFVLIRPYAWLALCAFVLGFAGCLALTWPAAPSSVVQAGPSMVSGPADRDWDLPKRI